MTSLAASVLPTTALSFIGKWWKLAVGVILGALLCYPVASCQGRKDGRAQMQLAVERANTKALEQSRRADALAAQQRITDTIAVSTREQELRNVITQIPDSQPDATRIALGCERLRRAHGGGAANLPAVCGSAGRAQAGAAR